MGNVGAGQILVVPGRMAGLRRRQFRTWHTDEQGQEGQFGQAKERGIVFKPETTCLIEWSVYAMTYLSSARVVSAVNRLADIQRLRATADRFITDASGK